MTRQRANYATEIQMKRAMAAMSNQVACHRQTPPYASQASRVCGRCIIARLAMVIALAAVLYLASFVLIFELREPALSWDEDNFGHQEVALGPRPREVFARPSYRDVAYDVSQWPFRLYRPLCEVWLQLHGYALPAEWR